jgi:transcriptional antiterminator RfaH
VTAWLLVQLKPNADRIAERNLGRQGFSTFRPLERKTAVRNGKFCSKISAFFPGYMFVSYQPSHTPWSLINSTYGVARLVMSGERPAQVPLRLIEELRDACDEDGVISLTSQLAVGTEVIIQSGTFNNFVGQIERLSPKERALVLIDFMGTQSRVNLPVNHLRVVSEHSSPTRGKS